MNSLQPKSVSILITKSSADIDQLAERLGGNCYFYHLGKDGLSQAYLFESESFAEQFINAVQFFGELIAANVDCV